LSEPTSDSAQQEDRCYLMWLLSLIKPELAEHTFTLESMVRFHTMVVLEVATIMQIILS